MVPLPDEPADRAADLTRFLNRLGDPDRDSGDSQERDRAELMPKVVEELQVLARHVLGGASGERTLQPTALVNSTYLKLFGANPTEWSDRRHFFAVAARAMRQVVIDHARSKGRQKRGGGEAPVTLDEGLAAAVHQDQDQELLELDLALEELEALDARQARVVELRFFAGLEVEQVAQVIGVSKATVERDWRFARAWLMNRIA